MAYTEKYPLNPTPQGDTVAQAVQKNRSEMLSLAEYMGKQASSGSVGLRQRVLSSRVVNGEYAYLSSSGLDVTLEGSVVPVVITFADGFNGVNAVDYTVEIGSNVVAWNLPANSTSYLYAEYKNGQVSYGLTAVKPVYQNTPPSAVTGAHYFNLLEQKMYYFNGSNWTNVTRVFLAKVVTSSTSVTEITYLEAGENSISSKMIEDKSITASKLADDVLSVINGVVNLVYPVGSIYCSTAPTNPSVLFGIGTWEYIEQGRVLLSQGANYKAGSTGGETSHILTVDEMPIHSHTASTSSAGNHTHTASTTSSGSHYHRTGVRMSSKAPTDVAAYCAQGNEAVTTGPRGYNAENANGDREGITNNNGSHTHSISITSDGDHTHTVSIGSTGSGNAHNNMQPYLSVYMWKRTA